MRRGTPVKQRFYEKVSLPDENGCMLWTASAAKGYGHLKVNGRLTYAHRFAYELMVGPIPEGLEIDYVRANGCRSTLCVTPDHLEAVTHTGNMSRGFHANKTHCVNGHERTVENTYVTPSGSRSCRVCNRLAQRRYQQRKRALQ